MDLVNHLAYKITLEELLPDSQFTECLQLALALYSIAKMHSSSVGNMRISG